jgi:hypothetical protein
MQFNYFNYNQDDGLMSIEDLRALRLQKKKIESDKKARKYILDINQRYRKMSNRKSNDFLKGFIFLKKLLLLRVLIFLYL